MLRTTLEEQNVIFDVEGQACSEQYITSSEDRLFRMSDKMEMPLKVVEGCRFLVRYAEVGDSVNGAWELSYGIHSGSDASESSATQGTKGEEIPF